MGLLQAFDEQRSIGPTHGSIASRIPLISPSGFQWTESELETDLVTQLAFSRRVRDLVTQGVIRFESGGKSRRYTSDVFVELWPDRLGCWAYFLIEVKPQRDLDAWRLESKERIAAAQEWCGRNNACFRIMTEKEIRTPHLANARRLGHLVGDLPGEDLFQLVTEAVSTSGTSTADLLRFLMEAGADEPASRDAIDRAVANGMVHCDLSQPYNDRAVLRSAGPAGRGDNRDDPLIKMLMDAPSS